jgi:hypothetical protein
MARFGLALFVVLSACGNAVVTTGSQDGTNDPTALLPGAEDVDAGAQADFDAGPSSGFGGQVLVPGEQPAIGATLLLAPSGLSTTTDENGSYNFDSVPPGPFTLTATLPGYQPDMLSGTLQANQYLTEPILDLEASRPLFAPDGGFSPGWMAFAPDGGPLYAADDASFWQVATDGGGATALTTNAPIVKPLGFSTDGTPVYFTGYQSTTSNGVAGHSGVLQFGTGVSLQLGFFEPGPYLIGDAVYAVRTQSPASNSQPSLQGWWAYSAAAPNPTASVTQAYATPAPQPTSFGLVGYEPTTVLGGAICAQGFSTTGVTLPAICPQQWGGMPTTIGVSADGNLAALAYSTAAEYGEVITSWQVAVLSAAGVSTELAPNQSAAQFDALTALVPLSPTGAAEIYSGGSIVVQNYGSSSGLQGTEVAALPDGAAIYLDGSGLEDGTSSPLPFNGSWSQPVISSDGAHVIFPGVPMVIDVSAWTSTVLTETPQTAQFSVDDSELLIVGADNSIHVVTFPAAGISDAALEGTATLALFTPDGKSVVYAGQDPSGNSGIFLQPAAPPPSQVPPAGTGTADGGTP